MSAPSRQAALPFPHLPPRGLNRTEAARYCGVSPNTFAKAVTDGILPKPFRLYGRVLWCRKALDAALDALSDATADTAADSWADYQ
jgi:predicted DNA-binding transcriptional regulator AlpA